MLSRLITRKEQAVLAVLAGSLILGASALMLHRGRQHPNPAEGDTDTTPVEPAGTLTLPAAASTVAIPEPSQTPPTPPAQPTPAPLVVSIQGAVRLPGVYTFQEGDRVKDLVDKAGGAGDDASLININLAARLLDGTTLIVPRWDANDYWSYQSEANPPQYTISGQGRGETEPYVAGGGAAGPVAPHQAASANVLINVNTASQEQLETLPGIGPKYAQEIIRFRSQSPFQSVEDLTQVHGIGPKRLEAIRSLVTVD